MKNTLSELIPQKNSDVEMKKHRRRKDKPIEEKKGKKQSRGAKRKVET